MGINRNIIILEELDFLWNTEDIKRVTTMHNKGCHINDISKEIKRSPAEILLVLVHVAVKKEVAIKPLAGREV